MRNVKHSLLALFAAASLVACGGGGGSTPTNTVVPVSLAGVAAKGILKRAKATAFEVVSGELKEVQSVTTDATGAYSFSLTPTDNPVVVKIEVVAGETKMLDESQIENGAYKEIDAPVGLTVRTMVESLAADRAEINANPFTEMAVSGAMNSKDASGKVKPLTNETWAASRAIMIQFIGGAPESIKPVAVGETPVGAQKTAMTFLTGLMSGGADALAGKMSSLSQAFQLQDNSDGNVDLAVGATIKAELQVVNVAGQSKLDELIAANPTLGLAAMKDTQIDFEQITIAPVNAKVEAERARLDSFVGAMKAGLTATENTLKTAATDFETRVKDVSMDLVGNAIGGAFDALGATDMSKDANGYIVLTPTCGNSCGFTLKQNSPGNYTITPTGQSYTGSATASGKYNTDGTVSLRYAGSGQQTSTGAQLGDFDINISATGVKADESFDMNSGSIAVTSLKLNGISDDGKFVAHVALTNGKMALTEDGKYTTVSAEKLEISTDDGDSLTGVLTELKGEKLATGQVKPRTLKGSLTGVLKSTQMLKAELDLQNTTLTADLSDPTKKSGKAWLNLSLVGGTLLEMTADQVASEITVKAVLTTNGNSITATTGANDSLTITSSTGAFTATLDANRDGKLMAGTTKIGDITNGVLKYDGRTVSLF